MKVSIDYQAFLVHKYGGVSRYHAEINKHINELGAGDTSTILQKGCNNVYLESSAFDVFSILNHWRSKKPLEFINKAFVKYSLKRFDAFHPSGYDPYFLQSPNLPPYVITIHDMIAEKYFPNEKEMKVQARNKKKVIEKASAFIAISEATKNDLLDVYDIPSDKVTVIHHGYPKYFEKQGNKKITISTVPYVLFVGKRYNYKNFNFFLHAFSRLPQSFGLKIIAVGPPPTPDEYRLIKSLKLEKVIVFEHFISEELLNEFYKQALCFVYPSQIEGFGMPLLEAFISDCPVICTDIQVFREIAGNDAAIYFEAGKADSLVNALESLINDGKLRKKLISNGHARLKAFDWTDSALRTLSVYKKVLDK